MPRRCLALLLCLCLLLPWLPGRARADVTIEEEEKMGKDALQEVLQSLPLIEDPDIVDYVRGLGQKLVPFAPPQPFHYQFYVARHPEINAFALPGGNIFVFQGMLETMQNEGEIVGVLAHEISHVARRHIANRMDKSKAMTIATMAALVAGAVLGVAVNPQLGSAVSMGGMAGGIQQQLAYSRADEEDADWNGFKIMTQAGYSPQYAAEGFRRLWRYEQQMYGGDAVPTYLRTHPTSPSRMERMERLADQSELKAQPTDPFGDYQRIQTRLRALYDDPDQARDLFVRQLKENPRHQLAGYGMALLLLRSQEYAEAQKWLEPLTRTWPQSPYYQREYGLCLMGLGQFAQARERIVTALQKLPDDPIGLEALGEISMQTEDYANAQRLFRKVLAKDPDNPEALHNLGMALGRGGQTGEASLYLGLALAKRGNQRSATYHLQRALEDPSLTDDQKDQAQKALDDISGKDKPPKPADRN